MKLLNRKKTETLPVEVLKHTPQESNKADMSVSERRAVIVSTCLELTGIPLESMAQRVANQAFHLGLTRLKSPIGAKAIIAGVISKQLEVSVFEWKCLVSVLSSPVLRAIALEADRTIGDEGQLERRAITLRACIDLTNLSLDGVAGRVRNCSYGYLNVRTLHGALAKEKLAMLLDKKQDLSDAEWMCVKIGVLNIAQKLIAEYLDSSNCVPIPPVQDTIEIRRRVRLIKGCMRAAAISAEEIAFLVNKEAANLQLDMGVWNKERVLDFIEERSFISADLQWRCMAAAVLPAAFLVIDAEIRMFRDQNSSLNDDKEYRVALIDGCMIIKNMTTNEVAEGVQRLVSRFEVVSLQGKILGLIDRFVQDVLAYGRKMDRAEWRCFTGILSDALFVIKHERDNLGLNF